MSSAGRFSQKTKLGILNSNVLSVLLYGAKQRSKLHGKDTSCLPSVAAELGKSIADKPTKIYINESLTPYRRRLFGKLNTFKNTNKWKYLWTTNGTIHLRQTDSSQTFHFDTMEDFEEFVNPQKDKK